MFVYVGVLLGPPQSRFQSFVPLDQRSENESSGSIHIEITIANQLQNPAAKVFFENISPQKCSSPHFLTVGYFYFNFNTCVLLAKSS